MSRKRHRTLDDSNGHLLETEPASSNYSQNLSKRSRIALAAERGGSVVSDDDDYNVDALMDDASQSGSVESPARSDAEQEEDEYDEIQAAEFMKRRFRELRENVPSDQGVIEEVFCRNFMCHSKLRIKLGPLINFIIGHNGSGKSAVLTALQMCLGGKATATNRGANLKSLIKEGEESSTLAVKIKNQGEGAYKPDLYGRSITVERHFNRSGTSGFKIRNSEDKVITTKKADLDDILDFFAFQLDNPINVLTQDLARQFLSNSSPNDKYKFFIRGTQLETLDSDYRILEEHLTNMEEKLAQREEDVKILEDRAKTAERKKKQLDDIAHVQARIDEISRMHAWAQVEEQEALLENHRNDLIRQEENVRELEQMSDSVAGAFSGHDQAYEKAKQFLADLMEQMSPLSENVTARKAEAESNNKELTSVISDQRRIKQTMDKCKRNLGKIQGDIERERQRLSEVEGGAHAERLARLEELKMTAKAAKHTEIEHAKGKSEVESRYKHASDDLERVKSRQKEAREKLTRAEVVLQRLQQKRQRKSDGYHPNIDNLIREIDRETRWRDKPVGPVGFHVHLLKLEWTSQIERTLGGTLGAFLVTNKDDQNILSEIMKRTKCEATIYLGDPTPLDSNGKEPAPDVVTIMRVLRIDNDFVRNTLITNHAVEQVALIKDRTEAFRYFYENPAGRPDNVRAVITMAARSGAAIRYERTARGEQKSNNMTAWATGTRMQTDYEEQLRIQRERVSQAKEDVDNVDQEVRHRSTESHEAQQAITLHKNEYNTLRNNTRLAEEEVETTQNEIEGNQPQHGKLQELERQLGEVEGELKEEEASYQDSVLAIDRLKQKGVEQEADLNVAERELAKATRGKDKAEHRIQTIEGDRTKALHERNEALAKVESAKSHITRLEGKVETQKAKVEEFISEAGKICARVPVNEGDTPQILDERLERLTADRQRRERNAGGTREELTAAWKAAELAYREANAQMKSLSRVSTALRSSLDERHRRWGLFRKYISMRARTQFTYLLSERNFRGRVLLDHSKRLLDISVEPDLAKASDAGRQARTLSGGEKSFSTICLLLSIWEAMGSPIRCLDEFDVFMDSVNRSTSMTMMIQAARRAVGRQFILITPQSMNHVELSDDVRIHRYVLSPFRSSPIWVLNFFTRKLINNDRMSDPERGQTTLPFGE